MGTTSGKRSTGAATRRRQTAKPTATSPMRARRAFVRLGYTLVPLTFVRSACDSLPPHLGGSYCRKLGCPEVSELHEVAHSLSGALHCAACSLWLVKDSGGSDEKSTNLLVTQLSAQQLEAYRASRQ